MTSVAGPTTILIADDHPMVREGLRGMLAGQGVEVVGEAATGGEAVERVHELQPDVVLMDIRMPDMDGLTATEVIKKERAETAVLFVTSYESTDYLKRAIMAGAAGYLLKGITRASLIDAIRVIRNGESLIDRTLLEELLRDVSREEPRQSLPIELFTPREQEALQLLARGLSNKEIAQEMHYSVGTVKNTVQHIIEKLGVSDRTQAAILAVKAGLATGEAEPTPRPKNRVHKPSGGQRNANVIDPAPSQMYSRKERPG